MPLAPVSAFRLSLLRHASAGSTPPGKRDFDRELDEKGFAEAEIISQIAADRGLKPDLVLCSTAMRCRQTADAFRRAVGENLAIRYVDALFTGPAELYRDLIVSQCHVPSLMVIGHNPSIEEVFRGALDAQAAASAIPGGYPAGALAVIDMETTPSTEAWPAARLSAWLDPQAHSK